MHDLTLIKKHQKLVFLYSIIQKHNVVGGEFLTSLTDNAFNEVIDFIATTILSKQTCEVIDVQHIWQKQSPGIHNASLTGLGDNTVAYGYYNLETKTNKTPEHSKLEVLGEKISEKHIKELPDGKLIKIGSETTISIEEGVDPAFVKDLGIIRPTYFKKSGS